MSGLETALSLNTGRGCPFPINGTTHLSLGDFVRIGCPGNCSPVGRLVCRIQALAAAGTIATAAV